MYLSLVDIRVDPTLQLRERLDMDRVAAMVEFEAEGGILPPITVVGDDNLLADGHHRLEAAHQSGKTEIGVTRIPGGMAEAVVAAIRRNDLGTPLPLTRTERNKGIKLLLVDGWTGDRIATATNVHETTIRNIADTLTMRGEIKKKVGGSGSPKPVTVLPKAVAAKLNDTVLVRIADGVPIEQQAEFAAAVAEAGLSEPRVREAIRDLRSDGLTPAEAVAGVTPQTREMPRTLPEVARQARKRLEKFLSEPMTVEGIERDFWAVLEVLARNSGSIPLEAAGLSDLLADVSVRADQYSSLLRSAEAIEATA